MRDGVCSKCQSATVHAARNGLRFGERGETVLYPHQEPNFRGNIPGPQASGFVLHPCHQRCDPQTTVTQPR